MALGLKQWRLFWYWAAFACTAAVPVGMSIQMPQLLQDLGWNNLSFPGSRGIWWWEGNPVLYEKKSPTVRANTKEAVSRRHALIHRAPHLGKTEMKGKDTKYFAFCPGNHVNSEISYYPQSNFFHLPDVSYKFLALLCFHSFLGEWLQLHTHPLKHLDFSSWSTVPVACVSPGALQSKWESQMYFILLHTTFLLFLKACPGNPLC